ncbi:hypothetical protein GGH99_003651, partial [Coemansia sp. RSA 1285]
MRSGLTLLSLLPLVAVQVAGLTKSHASEQSSSMTVGGSKFSSEHTVHPKVFSRYMAESDTPLAEDDAEVSSYQQQFAHIKCGPNNDDMNAEAEDEAATTVARHGAKGKKMVEVEVDYNPEDIFEFKKDYASMPSDSKRGDSFEHPSGFTRDVANYDASQGYPHSQAYDSNPYSSSSNAPYPTAAPYANNNYPTEKHGGYQAQQPAY